jgi:outer membrane murein-binding lipoprotein Lpp
MPVRINEVSSEVHALDAASLLTPEVLDELARRVDALRWRDEAAQKARAKDAGLTGRRSAEV